MPITLLCIATYRKGDEFLRECRRQGSRVLLVTDESLREADWPRDAIDAFYYVRRDMPAADVRKGAAYLARTERLDRIVALDDFDVETAANLREYLHVPGMGETTGRAFRDKLAMRSRARAAAIPCPDFVHAVNHAAIDEWTRRVPPPWILKPRSQAAAIGIRKISSAEQLRAVLDALGDARPEYVLEQFVPGDVFHVDSLVFDRQVVFASASRYATPPFAVAHEGGIFVTRTLGAADPTAVALKEMNARVLGSFGLARGVSHTEFIRAADGSLYFLETSARVVFFVGLHAEPVGEAGQARVIGVSCHRQVYVRSVDLLLDLLVERVQYLLIHLSKSSRLFRFLQGGAAFVDRYAHDVVALVHVQHLACYARGERAA
jgi:hypothetical protein